MEPRQTTSTPATSAGITSSPATADVETLLAGLRAVAESTRLRIVAVLAEGELTVSELCRILGQTQPRVSRHLRLLCEAGLLTRHSEGTSAFYAHTRAQPGRSMLEAILPLIGRDDRALQSDRQRLGAIRSERAGAADRYFEQIAGHWNQIRSLHVADAEVEAALLAAAERPHPPAVASDAGTGSSGSTGTRQGAASTARQGVGSTARQGATSTAPRQRAEAAPRRRLGRLIDIGTGTGRMLELFADRIDRGLGIDLSSGMLNLARSNLVARGLDHCSVRHGNVYALDVTPRSFDVAVVHHVLHYLENPAGALAEAASTLRPGGRLLVVDFAPHHLEILRAEHAHRRLGFADEEITGWCNDAGLTGVLVEHLVPPPNGAGAREEELLTVSLWSAIQPVTSSTTDEPFTAAAEPTASEHRPIASHQPGSADTPMEMCR